MANRKPIISFTFDDFPRSALRTGGTILLEHNVVGTYYASLGLMGKVTPTGEIFNEDDLLILLQQGHELGCHTYSHCHATETRPEVFERSIAENARALEGITTQARFQTLSYPIGSPRPETKRRAAHHFDACRGGGQSYNRNTLDLNLIEAFFLEQSRDDAKSIFRMIDETCRENGWLIFATHDVAQNPTPYGCQPAFFSEITRYAVQSGAEVLPVAQALRLVDARTR
jgi:peptidoglycan/xylan/chitin deacetylase (PgdA/CDA1 family)